MTITLKPDVIHLSGRCGVEEVETLVSHLERHPDLAVDIGEATDIHTALWQAFMVFRPKIIGRPMSSFIAEKLLPGLDAYTGESEPC